MAALSYDRTATLGQQIV